MKRLPSTQREFGSKPVAPSLWLAILCLSWSHWIAASPNVSSHGFFTTLDGQPASVEAQTAGDHWLVVMIWASDCHICNMEAEAFAHFHEEHKDKGIRMLGITMDGAARLEAAKAFVARHDIPFPNLIGEPDSVSAYYGLLTGQALRGTPTLLIFDPEGVLTAAQGGAVPPESIVRYIDRKRAHDGP